MFIRVSNAIPERLGDPLIINVNVIVAVFENYVEGGSLSTTIYANDNLIWNVEESLAEVEKKIKEALK